MTFYGFGAPMLQALLRSSRYRSCWDGMTLWLQPYLLRNNWGMTGGWIVSNFSGSTAASMGSKLVVNYTTPFLLSMLDEKIVDTCVDCKFMQFQAISGEIWLALGFKWYHIFRQKQCTTVFGTATPVISRIIYKVLTYFNLLRSCINWPALSFLRFHIFWGDKEDKGSYWTVIAKLFHHFLDNF